MGTLVCRVELNKKDGLIFTVENKDGKITQTAVLNGESITFTSKGEKETSTITQKPDGVTIQCKNFTLESETINCTSTKDTVHKSDQKYDIQSSQDMTLKSGANLNAKATQKHSLSGSRISAAADTDTVIKGLNVSVDGSTKTEIKGMTLNLAGTTKTELKGVMVDLSADGPMNIKGALTNIDGQVTSVKGTLTKVG